MITTTESQPGQTGTPTQVREPLFEDTPVRALMMLAPSLDGRMLYRTPRFVIGRQSTDVHWQIVDRFISRLQCVLHAFSQMATIYRHSNASQPVRLNGIDIGTQRFLLEPWTFINIGETTILVMGAPDRRPTYPTALPARSDAERAIQACAVYGSQSAAARYTGWSRRTVGRRLRETETGAALIKRLPCIDRAVFRRLKGERLPN